jgi:putative hydrolase of the HAD superfamily
LKYKHLFYDLDRTLWDFETNSRVALTHMYDVFNLKTYFSETSDFIAAYEKHNHQLWVELGRGKMDKVSLRTERFKRALTNLGDVDEAFIYSLSKFYLSESPRQTVLFPNVIETLTHFQKEGYAQHIITNGFREVQEIKIQESGLSPFFEVVVCSEDTEFHKPKKGIFSHALNLANAKAHESIMIGDDQQNDISGALNAQMEALHFTPHLTMQFQLKGRGFSDFDQLPLLVGKMQLL